MGGRSSLSPVAVAVAAVAGGLGRAGYRWPEERDRRMANEPVGRVVVCASARRGVSGAIRRSVERSQQHQFEM